MLAPNQAIRIPLGRLEAGRQATVTQLMGAREHVHRLHELGLRSGTVIEMVQAGNPCIVRIDGAKLCFRDCDALRVLVTVEEPS